MYARLHAQAELSFKQTEKSASRASGWRVIPTIRTMFRVQTGLRRRSCGDACTCNRPIIVFRTKRDTININTINSIQIANLMSNRKINFILYAARLPQLLENCQLLKYGIAYERYLITSFASLKKTYCNHQVLHI